MSSPAFADPVTVQIGARVNFVTPESLGLTVEEIEQGGADILGTPLWEGKQCCLQQMHHRGIRSAYCFSERVQEQLQHCETYLEIR